jgi:hypothetical protein
MHITFFSHAQAIVDLTPPQEIIQKAFKDDEDDDEDDE